MDGLAPPEFLALRLLGAIGGAIIAFAIVPAETWFPVRRASASLITGMILAPTLRYYMDWPMQPDHVVAAGCITSACSWWAWNGAITAIQAGWLPWVKKSG